MADRRCAPRAGGFERDGAELEPVDGLLGRYRRYLLCERELDPMTVVGYVHRVRPFLAGRITADGLHLVGKLDPYFDSASFSFKANCPTDFDCAVPRPVCEPPEGEQPPIDYL